MNEVERRIQQDHLAVGLTRPPMFMGVHTKVFFGNAVLCTLICLNLHTLSGVILFLSIHVIAVRLSIKEPSFLYLYTKTIIKTPPILNRWYWGRTNSYEPW